ncbi:MAG: ferric reductase-like transmembrane domain-containing protein [Verrucomicrobia bacterium]|nr:ferric reductase-like transmembrane domain-containing protein [Verrucomicrobiota bacterium]
MPDRLPSKQIWYGYSVVFGSVVASLALWVFEMWRAGSLHTNPWIYPAKVGSHGTLILMCWAFILATRFRPVERLFGGLDKVYRAHRVIGETAFFLIFLHPIFLAIAKTDSTGVFFATFGFQRIGHAIVAFWLLLFFCPSGCPLHLREKLPTIAGKELMTFSAYCSF